MTTKKPKVDVPIYTGESDFNILLSIHNEIKKTMSHLFPCFKQPIIDHLFSILSSQALLYDQIIRKSHHLKDSIVKQTQIAKSLLNSRSNFEKKIQDHLLSLSISPGSHIILSPLQERADSFTILSTHSVHCQTNYNYEEPLPLEHENIIAKIKQKIEKHQQARQMITNSNTLTVNKYEYEDIKMKEREIEINKKQKKVFYIKEKSLPQFNTSRKLEKHNSSYIHEQYNPHKEVVPSIMSLTHVKSFTDRKLTDKDDYDKKTIQNTIANYKSIPKKLERGSIKPSKQTKHFYQKYQDIVDSYERIESEEEEVQKVSTFQSKQVSKSDFRKKDNNEKSYQLNVSRSTLHKSTKVSPGDSNYRTASCETKIANKKLFRS